MSPRDPSRIPLTIIESPDQRPTAFTRAWYIAALVLGSVLVVGGVTPAWDPTLAIEPTPDWVSSLVGSTIAVGALLLLNGSSQHEWLDARWRAEQVGCLVTGGGWLAFSVLAAWAHPTAPLPVLMTLSFAMSMGVRWRTLRRSEVVTRAVTIPPEGPADV